MDAKNQTNQLTKENGKVSPWNLEVKSASKDNFVPFSIKKEFNFMQYLMCNKCILSPCLYYAVLLYKALNKNFILFEILA